MYGSVFWAPAPTVAKRSQPRSNNCNSSAGGRLSNNSTCSSERRIEDAYEVSPVAAHKVIRRKIHIATAKALPAVAAAARRSAVSPVGRGGRRRPILDPQSCGAEKENNLDSVRGGVTAGPAASIGNQPPLCRPPTAESGGYAKRQALHGRAAASRSIPRLQGAEKLFVTESMTAGEETPSGDGSLLVPLFKPDHTQDGPACACLQNLEPYTVLCCSAGAYAGNYFFISKDAHGEVLGGGLRLASSYPATHDTSPASQKDGGLQQHYNDAEEALAQGGSVRKNDPKKKEDQAEDSPRGPPQCTEHQRPTLDEAVVVPHTTVTVQHVEVQKPVATRQRGGEQQVLDGGEQPKAFIIVASQERSHMQKLSAHQDEPSAADQAAASLLQTTEAHKERCLSLLSSEDTGQGIRKEMAQWLRQQRSYRVPAEADASSGSFHRNVGHAPTLREEAGLQPEELHTHEQRCTVSGRVSQGKHRTADQSFKDFELEDVTMRIEHPGLSAVHARIWEDPGRKHLEDRLNIQDLFSEEGTWKKVRWDRPTPICCGTSNMSSSISSSSGGASVVSHSSGDEESEGGGGKEEMTGFVNGETMTATPVAAARMRGRGSDITKGEAEPTTAYEFEGEYPRDAGEGQANGETAKTLSQKMCRPTPHNGKHDDVPGQDGGICAAGYSLTRAALKSPPKATTPPRRGSFFLRRRARRQTQSPKRLQSRQVCHQQSTGQRQGSEAPDMEHEDVCQRHADEIQHRGGNNIFQDSEEQRRDDRNKRPITEKRRHDGDYTRGRRDERLRRRRSSSQVVNFGGRLLRFERGASLSPSEAFDEFLLTFDLLHLKGLLLACLKQRGCCCRQARRVRRKAASAVATSLSPPTAELFQFQRHMFATARAAGHPHATVSLRNIREKKIETEKYGQAAHASDSEELRASCFASFPQAIQGSSSLVRARDRALPERREGVIKWNSRLTGISRLKRNRLFRTHAVAAAYSGEDCASTPENVRNSGVKRWASLVSLRGSDLLGADSALRDSALKKGANATIQHASEDATVQTSGNAQQRDKTRGERETDGEERDDAFAEARGCDFRRSAIATKKERQAGSTSRSIWWRSRSGTAGLRGGDATKLKGNASLGKYWLKGAHKSERPETSFFCSTCEADPLHWLWRCDPLSLLHKGKSGSFLGPGETVGDGDSSATPERGIGGESFTDGETGPVSEETPGTARVTSRLGAQYDDSRPDRFKDTQKRRSLLLKSCTNPQPVGKHQDSPVPTNTPYKPFGFVLTPEEADRWRMACVELPRHFLPVREKSRPLTIYDEATGAKLGEVRWSGCFLVSPRQTRHCLDGTVAEGLSCTRGTASEAMRDASAIPLPDDADTRDPIRQQADLDKPQEECSRLEDRQASTTSDQRHSMTDQSDGAAGVVTSDKSADSFVREFAVAQLAEPMTNTAPPEERSFSAAETEKASAAYLESFSTPAESSVPSSQEDKICGKPHVHLETEPPFDRTVSVGHSSKKNRCPYVASSCSASIVSMSVNPGTASVAQTTVVSLTHTAECASTGDDMGSIRQRGLPSSRDTSTELHLAEKTCSGTATAPSPCAISSTHDSADSLDSEWSQASDPLKDCDCWPVSSANVQEDKKSQVASFAASPQEFLGTKGAAAVADKCSQEEELVNATERACVLGREAGSGQTVAGGAEDTPAATSATEIQAILCSTRAAQGKAGRALFTKPSTAPSGGDLSLAAANLLPRETPAAAPQELETSTDEVTLRQSAPQQQQQSPESSAIHGDDAPIEAVVQRLRISPVSLLLHGRLQKKGVCSANRGACSVEKSNPPPSCHASGPYRCNSTKAGTVVSRRAGDIRAGDTGGLPPGHPTSLDKLPHGNALQKEALSCRKEHVGDHMALKNNRHQRREQRGARQSVDIERVVGDVMKAPFSLYVFPAYPPVTGDLPARRVRRGASADCTGWQWSIDGDGLLQWNASRSRCSTSHERCRRVQGIGNISTFGLPSGKNFSSSSQGSILSSANMYGGTTHAAASLKRCDVGRVRETMLARETVPGNSISSQECIVRGTSDRLPAPAGLAFSFNHRQKSHSSSGTLRSPLLASDVHSRHRDPSADEGTNVLHNVTGSNADETMAYVTPNAESKSLSGPAHAINRRSLAAAAAEPLYAAVRSVATAVAAVAPAIVSAGAIRGPCVTSSEAMSMEPMRSSSCADFVSSFQSSSAVAPAFDSLGGGPPPWGVEPHTVGNVDSETIAATTASAGVSCAARFDPSACTAVTSCPPSLDRVHTVSSSPPVFTAADTFLKFPAALLPAASGRPQSFTCHQAGGDDSSCGIGTHDGPSTASAVNVKCTASSRKSVVALRSTSTDARLRASVSRWSLPAHAHAFGATVAGAIRSSIRTRRSLRCSREASTCHFPLLTPTRATSCCSRLPFPVAALHTPSETLSQSAPAVGAAARVVQMKCAGGTALCCFGDAADGTRYISTPGRTAALHPATGASGQVEANAAVTLSTAHLPVAAREQALTTRNVKESAVEPAASERHSTPELPLDALVVGKDTNAVGNLQGSGNLVLFPLDLNTTHAAMAHTQKQRFLLEYCGPAGVGVHCELKRMGSVHKNESAPSSSGNARNSLPYTRSSCDSVNPDGGVDMEANNIANPLSVGRRNTMKSIPAASTVREPASEGLAGLTDKRTSVGKSISCPGVPPRVEERDCLVHCTYTVGTLACCAAEMPAHEDSHTATQCREPHSSKEDAEVCYRDADGSDVVACDMRACNVTCQPSSVPSLSAVGTTGNCSTDLSQPPVLPAHVGAVTRGGMQTVMTVKGGATPQPTCARGTLDGVAKTFAGTELPHDVETSEERKPQICLKPWEEGRGVVAQVISQWKESAYSSTAPFERDLQDGCCAKLSLVHEARHRTSLESGSGVSRECSGLENSDEAEDTKHIDSISSNSGSFSGGVRGTFKSAAQTEEARVSATEPVNVDPLRMGYDSNIAARTASVSTMTDIIVCCTDDRKPPGNKDMQQTECSSASLPQSVVYVPSSRGSMQQVLSLEDSGHFKGHEIFSEQQRVLERLEASHTVSSLQSPADGLGCMQENSRSTTVTPERVFPLVVQEVGKALSNHGQEKASSCAQGAAAAVGGISEADEAARGVTLAAEVDLASEEAGLDVVHGICAISSTHNEAHVDHRDLLEREERQVQQFKGCRAEETITCSGGNEVGRSDNSVRRESEEGRSTHEEVVPPRRNSASQFPFSGDHCNDTDHAGGIPKARAELKRMLSLVGSGSKAKTPPMSPMERWWSHEERGAPKVKHATSAPVSGDTSSPVSVVEGLFTEEAESARRVTCHNEKKKRILAKQHRLRRPPTRFASECTLDKIADVSRGQHLAFTSATRKLLSFVVRPGTPSAHAQDGDNKSQTCVRSAPSCVVESSASSRAAWTITPEYQSGVLGPGKASLVDSSRVAACSGACCWNNSARVKSSAAFLEKLLHRYSKGNAMYEGSSTESWHNHVADGHQHTNGVVMNGQAGQACRGVAWTAIECGDVASVLGVKSRIFGSEGVGERNDAGADNSARLNGDCVAGSGGGGVVVVLASGEVETAKLKEVHDTGRVHLHAADSSLMKTTEGKCTGGLSTLQLAAAAPYAATRKKAASRLIGRPAGAEISAGNLADPASVGDRQSSVEEYARCKRKGERRKLFAYRKGGGTKRGAGCQCREEFSRGACRDVGPPVERPPLKGSFNCSSNTCCNGVQQDGKEQFLSELTGVRTRDYAQQQVHREHEGETNNKELVGEPNATVCSSNDLSSIRTPLKLSDVQTDVLDMNEVVAETSSPGHEKKSAEYAEERPTAVMNVHLEHENEGRILAQARAYLLRQNPRRVGFPEVLIPAATDAQQTPRPVRCGPGSMDGSPVKAITYWSDARNTGQEDSVRRRTLRPCYGHSAANEQRRNSVQRRMPCTVPSPTWRSGQCAAVNGPQRSKSVTGREIRFLRNSPRLLQKPRQVGGDGGGFAEGGVCGTICDKLYRKVLCVYVGGEYQLLLAEPEDEEGDPNASECVNYAEGEGTTPADNHSFSSSRWRTCSCWVRLQARHNYRLRPGDVLRVGPLLEFSLKRFLTGVASQQGYRLSMEDEEVAIQDLGVAEDTYCSFFAVYDGHGGRACAEFVKRVLHVTFRRELLRLCGGSLSMSSTVRQHVYQALLTSFLTTDAAFLGEQHRRKQTGLLSTSGCACVAVVILGGEVWCANCGDARAVLCRGGKALELSSDHKPHRKDELQRIVAAGGFVRSNRVLGRLAVSRAFGDVDYKGARAHSTTKSTNIFFPCAITDRHLPTTSGAFVRGHEASDVSARASLDTSQTVSGTSRPLVTAVPEIRMQPLCEEDEFLLLACDGLFDVFTSQEAADFVREALSGRFADFKDPQALVDALLYEAIEKRRSRDNVTAILVLISAGRSVAMVTGGMQPAEVLTNEPTQETSKKRASADEYMRTNISV